MPTYTRIKTAVDTTVKEDYPNTKYGSESYFAAGKYKQGRAMGFVKFPDGSEWAGAPGKNSIKNAYLHIRCDETLNGSQTFNLRVNKFNWDENMTWNNKPYGSNPDDKTTDFRETFRAVAGEWSKIKITDYVQQALGSSELRSYGFRIYQEGDNNGRCNFYSSESGSSPRISIEYEVESPIYIGSRILDTGAGVEIEGKASPDTTDVIAHMSFSAGSGYSIAGKASLNINANTWRFLDRPKLSAEKGPGNFNLAAPQIDGKNIKLDWGTPSLGGDTVYYKFISKQESESSEFSSEKSFTLSPKIEKYEVLRNGVSIAMVNGTTYTDTINNIRDDESFQYRVRAIDYAGNSSLCAGKTASITLPVAPGITSTQVSNDNKNIVVSGNKGAFGNNDDAPHRVHLYPSRDGVNYPSDANSLSTSDINASTRAWSISYKVPSALAPKAPVVTQNTSIEGTISISWQKQDNPTSKFFFKAKNYTRSLYSLFTSPESVIHTPKITKYIVQKALTPVGESNLRDSDFEELKTITSIPSGSSISISDDEVEFGKSYTYRVIAVNDFGVPSPYGEKKVEVEKPLAPSILSVTAENVLDELNQPDGRQKIVIKGNKPNVEGITNQGNYIIQRSVNNEWQDQAESVSFLAVPPPDWSWEKIPSVSAPNTPQWVRDGNSGVSVIPYGEDKPEINLKWTAPSNPSQTYTYQALRIVSNARGKSSNSKSVTISPYISYFTIFRRLKAGQNSDNPEDFKWQNIQQTPSLFYKDTEFTSGLTYEYKIIAHNNFGVPSRDTGTNTLTVKTSEPIELPSEEEPVSPVTSSLQPSGIVDIANTSGSFKVTWEYEQSQNSPQASYTLYRETEGQRQYLSPLGWVADQQPYPVIASDKTNVYLKNSDFLPGKDYVLGLVVKAVNGKESEAITTTISTAETALAYYDLSRKVSKNYTEYYDLHRKVINNITNTNLPRINVEWNVQNKLPIRVSDLNWSGGGNTIHYVVFDNDGRPEPYAELDFTLNGKTSTFKCDSRGRILITVSNKTDVTKNMILPGIYTLRERGPSMAPRTIHNHVVVDPGMIYNHGDRHASDGKDPIFGITGEQIASNADIPLEVLEGGESLKGMVNRYGSDIEAGINRSVSSGHPSFTSSGLNTSLYQYGVRVSGGSCWENFRYRETTQKDFSIDTPGTYKIYVEDGALNCRVINSFPPGSNPIATVTTTINGSGTLSTVSNTTISDERLYHPDHREPDNVYPVVWGASDTYDIFHEDRRLIDVLKENTDKIEKQRVDQEKLINQFYSENQNVLDAIGKFEKDNLLSRKINLKILYATAIKNIYSLITSRKAETLLRDNPQQKFSSSQMMDVYYYLNGMKNFTSPQNYQNVSVFGKHDELSSLSNIIVRNGVATLPNNWSSNTEYTMRTLALDIPVSKILQFHLIYEEIGSIFSVKGSIGNNGTYIPKDMPLIARTRDTYLENMLGVEQNRKLFISTYGTEFDREGNQAVVDLRSVGTSNNDGVRIRGWAITSA